MMKEKVRQYIEQYQMLRSDDAVVLGLSGGADSVCLLLLLSEFRHEIGFSLTAVHVEHGMRGEEGRRDASFSRALCRDLDVDFLSYAVDVPEYRAQTGESLEEAARELRYACFRKACDSCGADRIALAHHAEDCAETMLFHLARGTGIRGMSGIRPVTERIFSDRDGMPENEEELKGGNTARPAPRKLTVIRPLLCVTRTEIEEWLAERGQNFCTDSTNTDLIYARNRMRQQVLPELTQINAQAVPHMQRLSEQLTEICDYLDAVAWDVGQEAFHIEDGDGTADTELTAAENSASKALITVFCARFLALPEVLEKHLLQQLIGLAAGSFRDITSTHVEQVLHLMTAQVGAKVSLPHGLMAQKTYDTVRLCTEEAVSARFSTCSLAIPGETVLENGLTFTTEVLENFDFSQKIPRKSYTKWFDYDKIHSVVQLRSRLPGDYLATNAGGGHKKLTRYLIDEKVPLEERNRLCLVADGNHILWVVGYRISAAYKVTEDTKRILCIHVSFAET